MKNWTPYLAVWSFFALIVIGLAVYRKMLSNREDDTLHVAEGTAGMISHQVADAQRIDVIEKWGKSLTAVVVISGLVLAGIYFYGVWQTGATSVQ
jgi:hypothetical protein